MDETISVIQLSDGFSPHGIHTELPRAFSDTTPTTFTREERGNPEDPHFISASVLDGHFALADEARAQLLAQNRRDYQELCKTEYDRWVPDNNSNSRANGLTSTFSVYA